VAEVVVGYNKQGGHLLYCMIKSKIIKVNLGAGPDGVAGWINYDWGWLPLLAKVGLLKTVIRWGWLSKDYNRVWPEFKLVDIRKDWPVENDSVDFVYCSHVLEHLEKRETIKVLKQVRGVMKKSAVARFVLPDISQIVKIEDADELCRAWWGYDKDKMVWWQKCLVRGHRWMYGKKSFEKILKEVGFSKIKFLKYRQGRVPDLDQLDLAIHKDLSFYVEVEK